MNAIIVNCFDTYEHRVDLIHDCLISHGYNVIVLTSDYRHFEKVKRTEPKKDYVFFSAKPYKKNLSIERLVSHRSISKDILSYLESHNEADVLWVLVPPNSFVKDVADYKKKHRNVKLIFDVIDLWPETMPIGKIKKCFPFTIWKNLRDKSIKYADFVVTECNLYHDKINSYVDSDKIHTIYLARKVNNFDLTTNLPTDSIALCYLGSINNIIDIPSILNLIQKIKLYTNVTIHIIGDGEKRDEFVKACKSTDAEVIYHGKVYDYNEKIRIFNSCHYGLNFMKKSVFVGLTMKSMDYFEAGLPIINNIYGDTWELVEKYRIGINYSDTINPQSIINYDFDMRKRTRAFFCDELSVERFNNKVSELISSINNSSKTCISDIYAAIVTFNPDMDRLKQNINAIKNQVEKVLIVDNGSDNCDKLQELETDSIVLVLLNENRGIAAALNIAMLYAKDENAKWVITLDQDSICPSNYVLLALPFLSDSKIGQIVPVLYESKSGNYHYLGDSPNGNEYQIVRKSITSASITSVAVWEKVGGFDEDLFIDYVDYDYAMKLRLADYEIVRLNNLVLDHQLGNSINRKIGPFHVRVSNHSAFRKYYISRNIVIFMRRYGWRSKPFMELLRLNKMIILTLLYERDKKNKLVAITRGIKDGIKYRVVER